MRKAFKIVAAAVVGLGVQGFFFSMAVHAYYAALSPLAPYNNLMPGLGEAISAVAGGVVGAICGAIAAGFRGRASWWCPIILAAFLGAWTAMTEIHRTTHPALAVTAMSAASAFAGWVVAYLGKKIDGQVSW